MGELFPMEILVPYVNALRELVRVELDLFRQRVMESELPEGVSVEQVATLAAELGERLLPALRSQMLIVETSELARPWGGDGGLTDC